MAQYFTERLQKVFHMIFRSYNQKAAQEGLRQLELIVNNQQDAVSTHHRALRNDMSTLLESEINTKEDALTIANDPAARELGDAYALLARVYAGPRFTWEESNFPEDNMRTYQCLHDSIRRCSPIGTLQALRIKVLLRQLSKRICKSPLMMHSALSTIMQSKTTPIASM